MASDLFAAIRSGDLATVVRLLSERPSLAGASGPDGLSAVTVAAYHRQAGLLARLLAAGPELDRFEAAIVGDADRLGRILDEDGRDDNVEPESAASVDARAADGFTALHLAAFFGHPACVQLLLERGADPNAWATGPLHVQPLHSAAAADRADAARLLIDAGADVNSVEDRGFTSLMAAASNGDTALVDLLLAKGADPRAYNEDIRTAADLAALAGHAALAARLRRA